jgi:hemerythrin-like domain-containing protein
MSTAAKKAPASKAAAKKPAAHRSPSGKSTSKPSARGATPDAIKLLTSDHREVKALFQQYQEMVDHDAADEDKHPIAQQICLMLTVHAQIEEEIFYPAARDAIKEEDLVDEATVEHATAKDLIAQLEASDPSDDMFDAKVKVLGEYIDHHVKEEESEMFPQARKAKMDLATLGEEMSARKGELMQELGLTAEEEEPEEVAE